MTVLENERLVVRHLEAADAAFILHLVNDPDWLKYIGNRGVRTTKDAQAYIENGPLTMYAQHGFGLFCVTQKLTGTPVGICGLIKRPSLTDVDLGFALLPAHRDHGYAFESAAAVLAYGLETHNLKRIVALTAPVNPDSIKVLEKLGFTFEQMIRLSADGEESRLFARHS